MLPDSWVLGVAWPAILVTGVRIVTSYVIAAMEQVVMWSLAAAYVHLDGLEYIVMKVTEETNISIDNIIRYYGSFTLTETDSGSDSKADSYIVL